MVDADLEDDATTLVLGYGITGGAVRAAVATARSRGERFSGLVLQTLWPVPETAIGAALGGVQRVIVPELNPGLARDRVHRRRADRDRGGTHRRRTDLSRADLGGGGMTVTISAPYRNDTPYPFCPGCGHGGILDSLDGRCAVSHSTPRGGDRLPTSDAPGSPTSTSPPVPFTGCTAAASPTPPGSSWPVPN